MKIALAQLNYHIANFDYNGKKIKAKIEKAKQENVDIIIFSELAICGYPPQDLLEQKEFIQKSEKEIEKIAQNCKNIAVVIGAPSINQNPKGKKLHNAAYFLANETVKSIHHKTVLPTYDTFDENKYFEPNTEFNIVYYKGKRIAITIGEDLWNRHSEEKSFVKSRMHTLWPMQKLMPQNPDFIINIAASPFSHEQDEARREILAENAKNYGLPLIYVNQIGANAESIFRGGSLVFDRKGNKYKELSHFAEDFYMFNINNLESGKNKTPRKEKANYIEAIHDALILGIRDYFAKLHFKTAVLGLSGGIDSAVTLVLAERALGKENVRALLMPSKYSSEHSIDDAVGLANNLGIQYDIVTIQEIVSSFENSLKPIFKDLPANIAEENIQARARGVLLMAISNKYGNILLNTSNKSETAVGYGTLYGDMCGSISVLGDVYKTDVFKLAHFINKAKEVIPKHTITKPPSAELRPDQKDTDSLPEYEILDHVLYQYLELKKGADEIAAQGYDKNLIMKIINMVNRNAFKRFQAPPVLKVSTNTFGLGKKMPLVAQY